MKKITSVIFVLFMFVVGYGQDLNYSQFYEMPLLRNPALAGLFNCNIRVGGSHRSQWSSVTVPYQTSVMDVQYKFSVLENDYVTIGVQTTLDMAGDVKLKRTQLLPVVAYHLSLSGNHSNPLTIAFMAGPVYSQFNQSLAKLDDQFVNGAYSPNNTSAQTYKNTGYSYFDISTGLSYRTSFGDGGLWYAGLAMFHANSPRLSFISDKSENRIATKWVANGGVSMPTSDYNRLIGFADISVQGGNRQFIGGGMYETDVSQYDEDDNTSFAFGAFYRWFDALIPVVRLTHHQWQIGLSYDANVSKLTSASGGRGGFEITASFLGCLNIRNADLQQTKCKF